MQELLANVRTNEPSAAGNQKIHARTLTKEREECPDGIALMALWITSILLQLEPQANAVWGVELQQRGGGATHRGDWFGARAVESKVFRPTISAWVEEKHGLAGLRIDRSDIRSLRAVAVIAGQR